MKGRSWLRFSEKFLLTGATTTLNDFREWPDTKQCPDVIRYCVEITVAPQTNAIFWLGPCKLKRSTCQGRVKGSLVQGNGNV